MQGALFLFNQFKAMEQLYDRYTAEHQEVWQKLFSRQTENLSDKAAAAYLHCLEQMAPVLHARSIPRITELNAVLGQKTGWSVHIVPGLIPAAEFLGMLAERKFCSSTWLRSMDQLDYLEEPDMFHDIYGHIPLLYDERYARLMQQIGRLGVRYGTSEKAVALLERFYWFTIEFGVMQAGDGVLLYGAGIMSSFLEAKEACNGKAKVRPFDLDAILGHHFVKSELQQEYFALSSFGQLYECIPVLEAALQKETLCVEAVE